MNLKQSSHVRYLYYVINTEYSGVIYANLKDNPQNGKEISIPACKAPKFKAGKALKDEVNR